MIMGRKRSSPVTVLLGWLRRQSMKVKIFLGAAIGLIALIALKFTIKNRNHFFVVSEAVHVAGILVLIYKLTTQKTSSGNIYLIEIYNQFYAFVFFGLIML